MEKRYMRTQHAITSAAVEIAKRKYRNWLSEVTQSNMANVKRLNRGGPIRRRKKKANLMNQKRILSDVVKYSYGCTVTKFLFR